MSTANLSAESITPSIITSKREKRTKRAVGVTQLHTEWLQCLKTSQKKSQCQTNTHSFTHISDGFGHVFFKEEYLNESFPSDYCSNTLVKRKTSWMKSSRPPQNYRSSLQKRAALPASFTRVTFLPLFSLYSLLENWAIDKKERNGSTCSSYYHNDER